MVTTKRLPQRAKSYILAVIVVGSAIGMLLAARAELRLSDALPLIVFCGFGILASAVNIARRSITHSRLSYQIGSSFAYPLLVLVEPGAVCIVFTLMTLADKIVVLRAGIIEYLAGVASADLTALPAADASMTREALGITKRFMEYHLERRLVSLAVLDG